jgi:hypothetical protein
MIKRCLFKFSSVIEHVFVLKYCCFTRDCKPECCPSTSVATTPTEAATEASTEATAESTAEATTAAMTLATTEINSETTLVEIILLGASESSNEGSSTASDCCICETGAGAALGPVLPLLMAAACKLYLL